ncbi:MAG: hypothetical protein LBC19_00270 [Tannerella sp.]|jgi:hypothetical protein|nr:hypothetical protein [Tannerella sp.]
MRNFRFKFVTLATAIVSTLFIFSCNWFRPEPEPDTLTVSETQFTFEADDTEVQTATITTSASEWTFLLSDDDKDWVSASSFENTLYILVQKYSDTQKSRNATITIEAGNADPVLISITQNAKNSLSLDPGSLTYESDETGDKPVSVKTTASTWDATTNASWVKLSKQGNTLTVNVSTKNTTTSPRTATIKITAGNADEETLTVTQAKAHTLSISPSSLSFEADETGVKPVTITTTASSWSAATDASWVRLEEQGNTLKVSVTANTSSSTRSATVRIAAGTAPDRTLTVAQAATVPLDVTYNSCRAYYVGSTNTGTALFMLDLYNSNNSSTGVLIYGYGTKPECPKKFVLPTGTYSVNQTKALRTCFPGMWESGITGTRTYINNASKYLITGGTFTIQTSSGSGYAISTNFSGEDANTGAGVSGIHIKYTGSISFIDESDEPDCVTAPSYPNGSYSATGTPWISSSNAKSWSGRVSPNTTSGTPSRFTITNWGNESISIYCNYKGGQYILDTKTKVAGNSIYDGYLRVGLVSGDVIRIAGADYEHIVSYNSSTRTFDFSSGMGNLAVGVLGVNKQTGVTDGYFTDVYTNAKLVVSSSSSAPQSAEDAVIENAGMLMLNSADLKKYKFKEISASVMRQMLSDAVDGKDFPDKNNKKILQKLLK